MIDFKEIPQANTGSGYQDTFELFCRDFFRSLGYIIKAEPARGADNGRDLIISERFESQLNLKILEKNWLVSCKHYSFSGKSITASDEQDINDRLVSHNCDGFIGFYSTIANESLIAKLNKLEYSIFDRKRIENVLITDGRLLEIFKAYFPISYSKYLNTSNLHKPLNLFEHFVSNHELFQDSIFFHKQFSTENLYNGFFICNTIEELLKYLGFELRLVKFIKDYDKVSRTIFIAGYNEHLNEEVVDYEIMQDEKIPYEKVRNMVQEIILDYKIPTIIRINSSGFSAKRLIGKGVYFYTNDEIYMNIFEYRHTTNIFREIKNKYFE